MATPLRPPTTNALPKTIVFVPTAAEDNGLDWLSSWRRDYTDFQISSGSINAVLNGLDHPAILICRAQACQALAEWSSHNVHRARRYIAAALLVAPAADHSVSSAHETIHALPFLSVVIASRNSPTFTGAEMLEMARRWGSIAIDGGMIGMADGDAQLGDWGHGRHVLNWLVDQVSRQPEAYASGQSCSAGNILSFPPLRQRHSGRLATRTDMRS